MVLAEFLRCVAWLMHSLLLSFCMQARLSLEKANPLERASQRRRGFDWYLQNHMRPANGVMWIGLA